MLSIAEMDLMTWKQYKDNSAKVKPNNAFKEFRGGILGENPG